MKPAPLHIDSLALPGGAVLGMSHCPGRRLPADGPRSLEEDLAAIEAWGARNLLTLVREHEFAALGVPQFAQAVAASGLRWLHVPIADMSTPDATTLAAWQRHAPTLADALAAGERVLVHCAWGLGRTGLLAARLLVDAGVPPDQAIAQVRRARPGTLETQGQVDFVSRDTLLRLPRR